jgi:hypothetical protein
MARRSKPSANCGRDAANIASGHTLFAGGIRFAQIGASRDIARRRVTHSLPSRRNGVPYRPVCSGIHPCSLLSFAASPKP